MIIDLPQNQGTVSYNQVLVINSWNGFFIRSLDRAGFCGDGEAVFFFLPWFSDLVLVRVDLGLITLFLFTIPSRF
jgi:hypothetical protein